MKKGLLIFLGFLVLVGLLSVAYHFSRPVAKAVHYRDQEFEAHGVAYLQQKASTKSVIILPPTGGMNILDKLYAESLHAAEFDVYVLTDWTGSEEYALDLGIHQRFYTRVQRAIGLLIKNITSDYIGILGTSVGGLHASIAISAHERLNAALVITAGTPIPEVIVHSSQEAMKIAKRERYKIYGFKDDADYLTRLHAAFHLDPAELPRDFEGKKLGVVIATKDDTVPTLNQEKLKTFWKAQEVKRFDHDHFYGIVRMGLLHRSDVVSFFSSP